MKLIKRFLKKISKKSKPLSTRKVGFSYENKEVLRDISFNLKKGEIVAIVGKSGSGKSTFLKLVAGILSRRYQGRIRVFGSPKSFKKSKIGFVPQEPSFIPDLSLEDNIKIIGLNFGISEKESLEKANNYMRFLKLEEDLKKFPRELSGGQQARFNIVLSFLHDPDVLILDEPFVGLDFLNRRILWHFIESMKKRKKSIVLTSHLLTETQEHVNRLVILKNGKIMFRGKLENLKNKLKIGYVLEVRFNRLSKTNLEEIKKFCSYKDIKILDIYENYFMFALSHSRNRDTLFNLFEKLNLNYVEIGYREPNLDEIFLKT